MIPRDFSGKIGYATLFVLPMVVALLVGVGFVAGHIKVAAEHAIVSMLVGIAMWVASGFGVWGTIRLGKIRNLWVGLACTACVPLIAVITSRVVGWQIHPEGASKGLGFFAFRNEIARIGPPIGISQWHLSGWWFSISSWAEILCGLMSGLLGTAFACGPRFCEKCEHWASRTVWRFKLREPDAAALEGFRNTKTVRALTAITRKPSGRGDLLEIKLKSCVCGGEASINADYAAKREVSSNPNEMIVAGLDVDASEALSVFEWAEIVDSSMSPPRPKLALRDMAKELTKQASDPSFGSARIHRDFSAAEPVGDNVYTDWLRGRMKSVGDFELAEVAVNAQIDINDRMAVIEVLAGWPEPPIWLQEWVREMPNSVTAAIVHGWALTNWAWSARGADWTPKDWLEFQRRLVIAESELRRAVELAPRDPIPWALMIPVAKGRQLEQSEIKRLFKECLARSPSLVLAYLTFVQAASSKWGGSDEQMLALARQVAAKTPAGSAVPHMLLDAHIECAASVQRSQGDAAWRAYWGDSAVANDIKLILGKCFPESVERWTLAHDRAALPMVATLKFCNLTEEFRRFQKALNDRDRVGR